MPQSPEPPRRWRRLLQRVLPVTDRDDVSRELDALYLERVESRGEAGANRWYRGEVLSFITTLSLARLTAGLRAIVSDSWRDMMWDLVRDVRLAIRSLRRTPGVAVLSILTLALGVGAGTLIFTVVDNVALRSLPYAEPERIVSVWYPNALTLAEFDALERDATSLQSVGAFAVAEGYNLEIGGRSERVEGAAVSPSLFTVLEVDAVFGRAFTPEEGAPGAAAVALISQGLWLELFAGDPGAVGTSIVLDGVSRSIVGILPADFAFPEAGLDVFVPVLVDRSAVGAYWGLGGYSAIGRLAPGATPASSQNELAALGVELSRRNPVWTPAEDYRARAPVVPLRESMVDGVRTTFVVLVGAVGLLLLVACANVTNLLLARGLGRERLTAVRAALGASRLRLVRAHLVESLLLAIVGCLVGLVAARWVLGIVVELLPVEIPRAEEITLDLRVAVVGIGMALLAGLVAGLVPALRGSRVDPGAALREGGLRSVGGSAASRSLSQSLVVGQIAAAVVLVVGAGLLVRSLDALVSVETGFSVDGLSTARITLPSERYSDQERSTFVEALAERLSATPGLEAVSVTSHVPFGPGAASIATHLIDVTEDPNSLPMFNRVQVHPGYFDVMGVPLRSGRDLSLSDRADEPMVVLVDETAADRFWPDGAIGQRIRYPWASAPEMEIVGVVGGVTDRDLSTERVPTFYQPYAQAPTLGVTVVVRGAGGPQGVVATLRRAVAEVDDRLPVSDIAAMESLVAGSVARDRWTTIMIGLFAAVTLLMGCVGVYGVVACSVRQRTREIGVRVALGADRATIRREVILEGMRITIPGAVLGIVLAIPATALIRDLLFGVSPLDPLTFAVVPLSLVLAGGLAVYGPSRRATRIDPIEALRQEG